MSRAPVAERKVTPGKNVVRNGLVGPPTAKFADGVGRLPLMGPCRSATTPKGVPSETGVEYLFRNGAEEVGVISGGAFEES